MLSIVVEPSSVPRLCFYTYVTRDKRELCYARVIRTTRLKINLVPMRRLELLRLMTQEPKSCMSTNSTTPANILVIQYSSPIFYIILPLRRHKCLAADYLLLILLRLSSYSIPSLFSNFRFHESLALRLSLVADRL